MKKRFFFLRGGGEIVVSFFGVAWKSKFFWICGTKLVERVVCLEVSRGSFHLFFLGLANYFSEKFSPNYSLIFCFVIPRFIQNYSRPNNCHCHHLNEAMAASSLLCGTFLGLLLAGLVTWIYGRGAGRIMQLIQVDFPGVPWRGLRVRV